MSMLPIGSRWTDRYFDPRPAVIDVDGTVLVPEHMGDKRVWVVVTHPDLDEPYLRLEGQDDTPLFQTIEHVVNELGPLAPVLG